MESTPRSLVFILGFFEMRRNVARAVLAAALAAVAPAAPGSATEGPGAPSIIVIANRAALEARFCAADPAAEAIIVLPAALFVDSEELVCPQGAFKLYRIREHSDPDDFEYYLDPPFGTTHRLGCDGKAGATMKTVALNCRPE